MPRSADLSASRVWRFAALSLFALTAAACSDSGRFDVQNPFKSASNTTAPRQSQEIVTGSVSKPAQQSARVEQQPLPAPSKPETVAANGGVKQGAQGLGAYRPNNDITGSVPAHRPQPNGRWTWEGGTPVTVGQNDTLEIIARKYGVPIAAVMQANNIKSAGEIKPGDRLVIPRYSVTEAPASAPPAVAAPVARPAQHAAEHVHVVNAGESLMGIARKYNVTLDKLAKANNIQQYTKVNMGDRLTIPGTPGSAAQASAPKIEAPRSAAPEKIASAPAQQTARIATPEPVQPEDNSAVKTAEATGALPSFRWPAKGRVVTAFGSKVNGQSNDGINIALPEGTPIKAAEDGEVAYAGNELKGYGNLVLVRHANGFVSAYAHASEILVKRGDKIKRGHTIARSGQTGNVTSPQLHFEIRKGSTPVDPAQYLGG